MEDRNQLETDLVGVLQRRKRRVDHMAGCVYLCPGAGDGGAASP
jgi:hypothetical protein